MARLELSEEEVRTLVQVLDYALSELRMEIADTDRKDFREGLKAEKQTLSAILERLRGAESGPAAA
ncbi:hypothetical protein [Deferrisoma camini]|uniref:hypothetical protein n=1 Tax=Deferrisoma camini TaxID=1035120 RepID=UPI00046C8E92|nr:hypothetical protein [Deferrisoma camini]